MNLFRDIDCPHIIETTPDFENAKIKSIHLLFCISAGAVPPLSRSVLTIRQTSYLSFFLHINNFVFFFSTCIVPFCRKMHNFFTKIDNIFVLSKNSQNGKNISLKANLINMRYPIKCHMSQVLQMSQWSRLSNTASASLTCPACFC